MKLGALSEKSVTRLEWLHQNGFQSFEWNRFQQSDIALAGEGDWQPLVQEWKAQIDRNHLLLSSIGAVYTNALDPLQQEDVRRYMLRAIQVARKMGVSTVSCFSGTVIEQVPHPRRGAPVDKPYGEFIDRLCDYWRPIVQRAHEEGIQIAFENCTQGQYYLPIQTCNLMAFPAYWQDVFDGIGLPNIGLEWDPSHLICQGIDYIQNLKDFSSRIFHVHAKDAEVNESIVRRYGRCHPDAARHRFPGYGQANWSVIFQVFREIGYDSGVIIEGWHDPVLKGERENEGLLFAKNHLAQFV